MAKKAVGKVKTGQKKTTAKVIVPIKSVKTGAYSFQETFLPTETVKDFLAKRK